MKKIITLFVLSLLTVVTYSQMDINAFNATGGAYSTSRLTDYQCLGVNPANLGWSWNKSAFNLGIMETGFSVHTNALTRSQVVNDLFDDTKKLSFAERQKAAEDFTDKRLWAQLGITWIGLSYQNDNFGGIAFNVRDRMMWNTKFNSAAARFIFLGYHDSYFDSLAISGKDTVGYATNPKSAKLVYEGTSFEFVWYKEFNLAYGRSIFKNENMELFGGIGLKYIIGYGSLQYLQTGTDLYAFSALSPLFDVDYGTPTPSQVNGKGLKKVGSGMGFDFGLTYKYKKDFKASFAITDMGSINWDGNVYEGQDVKVWKIETAGIENYNIFQEGELIKTDNAPDDPGQWKGLENKRMSLATTMRFGLSYKVHPKLEVGTDFILPMKKDVPGAYDGTVFALGSVYQPAKWVQLSLGLVSGKELGFNVPFGVSFYPAHEDDNSWTLGFGIRDISSYMKQNGPTVSFAFGFLRFSFGKQ